MVKLFRLAAAAAIALNASTVIASRAIADTQPRPDEWVEVSVSEKGSTYYVDPGSIQGKGQFRYYWAQTNAGSPITDFLEQPAYGVLAYESVDCASKEFRSRVNIWIDQHGKPIQKFEYGDKAKLQRANPVTGQGAVVDFVCSY